MGIHQISVFLENRAGQLAEITSILSENKIDMRAISIAETTDYGVLRLIVSEPERTASILLSHGFILSMTPVVAVAVPDEPGGLARVLHILAEAEIDIEYMYAFANGSDAAAVLKSDEPGRVIDILKGSGFDVYTADEAYRANV